MAFSVLGCWQTFKNAHFYINRNLSEEESYQLVSKPGVQALLSTEKIDRTMRNAGRI